MINLPKNINNLTINSRLSQQIRQQPPTPILSIREDPVAFFEGIQRKKPKTTKIIECIIFYNERYQAVFPSQEKMAFYAGCTRRQVSRAIKILVEWGLIQKIRRPYASNLYIVTSYFKNSKIRASLRHIFRSLKWLSFMALANVSILNSNNKNIKLYSIIERDGNDLFKKIGENLSQEAKDAIQHAATQNVKMFSPEVDKLKKLGATKYLQCIISRFDDSVVKYASSCAQNVLRQRGLGGNEFPRLLFSICTKRSADLNLRIDYAWSLTMIEGYGFKKGDAVYDPMLVERDQELNKVLGKSKVLAISGFKNMALKRDGLSGVSGRRLGEGSEKKNIPLVGDFTKNPFFKLMPKSVQEEYLLKMSKES